MKHFASMIAIAAALSPGAALAEGDWSGPYVGAHAGVTMTDLDYAPDLWGTYGHDLDEFRAGLLAGYTWDLGDWTLGGEGDATFFESSTGAFGPMSDVTLGSQYSLRARLGYDAGNALYYVTGGVAWAELSSKHNAPVTGTPSTAHQGYILGGGAEFAWTENLNVRAEYLYSSFDQESYEFSCCLDYAEFDQHAVRAAVVLHW
ncbi:MAG: porin family protein [Hyphomonadaceae bacterium]|nr:porin family protein [Hyphomonadaceae bacterium]